MFCECLFPVRLYGRGHLEIQTPNYFCSSLLKYELDAPFIGGYSFRVILHPDLSAPAGQMTECRFLALVLGFVFKTGKLRPSLYTVYDVYNSKAKRDVSW